MPDPSIKPFSKIENEPYTNSQGYKSNEDAMLDKMNEFADNTFKMGESIFRSISTSDFFTKRGYST